MKESGSNALDMVKVLIFSRMVIFMLVNIKMENLKERANISGQMVIHMLDSSKMV